jgi:hypothetical protein
MEEQPAFPVFRRHIECAAIPDDWMGVWISNAACPGFRRERHDDFAAENIGSRLPVLVNPDVPVVVGKLPCPTQICPTLASQVRARVDFR